MPDVRLNLWRKDLRSVPDSVWERTELETLILADNGLTEVSERLCKLKHLRTLDLGHNQLTSLPQNLGDLTELSDFLYLHDNRLATVPSSIGRLQKLRYLNISDNLISAFPGSICSLSNLIELRATDNQITTLPDDVARLSRLRELHLRNNKLATLPSAIAKLTELRQLDLRGNPLESLPSALVLMPKLEKLDLRWVNSLPSLEWFQFSGGPGLCCLPIAVFASTSSAFRRSRITGNPEVIGSSVRLVSINAQVLTNATSREPGALLRFYDVDLLARADRSSTSAMRIENRCSHIRSQTEWWAHLQYLFLENIGFSQNAHRSSPRKPGESYSERRRKSLVCK